MVSIWLLYLGYHLHYSDNNPFIIPPHMCKHVRFLAPLLAIWVGCGPVVVAQSTSPTPKYAFAEPTLSPDGGEIAFVSGGDIWTVPVGGW